jgi:nucleotide-binding universal stress UspA family protein
MFERILVPLDGTATAGGILPYVSQLASGLNTPVVLLTVVDAEEADVPNWVRTRLENAESEIRRRLEFVADMLRDEGLTAEPVVSFGKPAEKIVQIAEREGCGLVAMSTHGRSVLGRGVLGSVTDKVIHSSHLPVLTITPDKAELYRRDGETISRVMVPLDGSPLAEAALPVAERLAQTLSMELILVRVINTGSQYAGILDDARSVDILPEIEAEATAYIERLAGNIRVRGLEVRAEVLKGSPAETLVEYARRTPQDIVAMTSHGRSGLARWWLGSISEALVRSSGDPVLVIPPPEGAPTG